MKRGISIDRVIWYTEIQPSRLTLTSSKSRRMHDRHCSPSSHTYPRPQNNQHLDSRLRPINRTIHSHCQPLFVLPQPLVDMFDLEIMNLLSISVESDLNRRVRAEHQSHDTQKARIDKRIEQRPNVLVDAELDSFVFASCRPYRCSSRIVVVPVTVPMLVLWGCACHQVLRGSYGHQCDDYGQIRSWLTVGALTKCLVYDG